MAILDILPDPNNKSNEAGEVDASGTAGPGFASVQLSSKQNIMTDRANSGRVIRRAHAYHQWDISISYNPMTKTEFDPIYTFLLEKQVSMEKFKVELPQYNSQGTNKTVSGAHSAGTYTMALNAFSAGAISRGDIFNIDDNSHTDHTKTYMVTRVDAASNQITFTPALAKAVTSGATVNFAAPAITVIQAGNTVSYSLNTENLYTFSLKLEEASS
jgi:hypothetical protein